MVLFVGFYFGVSVYASDSGLAKFLGLSAKNDKKDTDELYEILNTAAYQNREIPLEEGFGGYMTSNMVEDVASDLEKRDQLNKIEEKQKVKIDSFDKIGLVLTEDYVSVKESDSDDSEEIAKMFNGSFAQIIEKKDNCIKIKSGEVEGYIKGDNLTSGEDARALYDEYVKKYATINSDSEVEVKKDAKEKSDTVAKVAKGERYEVLKMDDDWIYILIGKETKGYISTKNADIFAEYAVAISVSEEKKMLEAEKKALLKAKTSEKNGDSGAKISYSGSTMSMNDSDFAMFVALIFSESGNEPYDGKVAVAQVIINRIKSGKYPNTLEGVVYQSGQFGPARNGALDKNLNLYKNGGFQAKGHKESIQAAKDALNGADIIGSRTSFNGYNAEKDKGHSNSVRIGNHLFY